MGYGLKASSRDPLNSSTWQNGIQPSFGEYPVGLQNPQDRGTAGPRKKIDPAEMLKTKN